MARLHLTTTLATNKPSDQPTNQATNQPPNHPTSPTETKRARKEDRPSKPKKARTADKKMGYGKLDQQNEKERKKEKLKGNDRRKSNYVSGKGDNRRAKHNYTRFSRFSPNFALCLSYYLLYSILATRAHPCSSFAALFSRPSFPYFLIFACRAKHNNNNHDSE